MSIDVLVIGGGPVGLEMGIELMRHGVSCRVLDEKAAPERWSKAAAVTPRTLEILRNSGVADALHARGRPMYGFNLYQGTKRLAHIDIQLEGTPYPYILGASQRDTELILADRLASLGGRLERETELVSFEQDDDRVRAIVRRRGASEEEIEARYLVGCDGAHSTTRRALGLAFEGSTFEQRLWQADIRVRFPFDVDPHEAYGFPSEHGLMGALPLFTDGRYRLIALAPPNPDDEPTLEGLRAIAKLRLPAGTEIDDPAWIVGFRFHGRLAERYRKGRVFLAGDAAHIHSPVGGQGMNLGIQDAANLAWKLALVLHGGARPEILDSYEAERRAIARNIVTTTDRATRGILRVMALRHPAIASLRAEVVSFVGELGFVQARVPYELSGIGVGYPASPIVGEHHSSPWTAEIGRPRDERPSLADWVRFSRGPGPGERVPDMDLPPGWGAPTLHELLLGTRHLLLLFDGAAATPAGYENLSAIARHVAEKYGDRIRIAAVVPRRERPEGFAFDGPVLLDPDAEIHASFGCGSEGLYLIRPDGYVAFRSQPADLEAFAHYLATVWRVVPHAS
jgi:2-polyprenyl-6-methoxyphenol hydroxylase-like FAD-dependent oxidoreductase